MCTFEFHISGYSLPEVIWKLKHCKNDSAVCEQLKQVYLFKSNIEYKSILI